MLKDICINIMQAQTHFEITLQKIVCNSNSEYVHNISCELKKLDNSLQTYSLQTWLRPNVTVDTEVSFTFSINKMDASKDGIAYISEQTNNNFNKISHVSLLFVLD